VTVGSGRVMIFMEFNVYRYCNLDRGDEQASCLSTLVCLPFLGSRFRTVFVIAVFGRCSDWPTGRTVRGSIAGRDSASLMSCPDRQLGLLSLMLSEYQAVYPQNKSRRDVKLNAHLAIAESKNRWSCTSSHYVCLCDTSTGNTFHCSLRKSVVLVIVVTLL